MARTGRRVAWLMKILMLCGLGMVLVASACGGGESSPEEQCEDLVETVCDRVTSCLDVPSEKAACIRGAGEGLDCSAAKSVNDRYDTCMDQIERASCDALVDFDADGDLVILLPESCGAVIEVGRLGAPSTPFRSLRDLGHLVSP
jgi:hypothetical protein